MSIISLEGVSRRFGERQLFAEVSIGLEEGQKTALVGVNGSGKTSLMKILAGLEPPDTGQVSKRQHLSVAYLPQVPQFEDQSTVLNAVFQGQSELMRTIQEYEMALTNPEVLNDQDHFQRLIDKMDSLQAWDYEQQVKEILGTLNIHNYEAPISQLSGGQRKRVALAGLLIKQPDVMILDEPTNHLDIGAIEWLEQYLAKSKLTIFLVTHDRYFLDSVCDNIVELDQGKVHRYKGNYSQFLEKKAEREAQLQKETESARNLLRKELDWLRRQPKARGTKAKYRVDQVGELQQKAQQKLQQTQVDIAAHASRQGKKVLEIDKLNKQFGENVMLRDFSYIFKRRDRVGIVGKNGVGKSTFLELLTGSLAPDAGKIDRGQNTRFGYYRQQELQAQDNQRVIDFILEYAEVVKISDKETITASQFLNRFGFPPSQQQQYISKLSGGEKRRLQLLEVLVTAPNFLILDEPTNDLDIVTLNRLEEFLAGFDGSLMLVTHDRYFLDKLVDHLFVFEGDGAVRDFPGNYSEYREWQRSNKSKPVDKVEQKSSTERVQSRTRKLSYKAQRELEGLEQELAKLEQRKTELLTLINEGTEDHQQLTKWSTEFETVTAEIDTKEMRWLELSEI